MVKDDTLLQCIETTLYTAGVHESGALAEAVMDAIREHAANKIATAHVWHPSTLGHGNWMCKFCLITDLEAYATNSHVCEGRDKP